MRTSFVILGFLAGTISTASADTRKPLEGQKNATSTSAAPAEGVSFAAAFFAKQRDCESSLSKGQVCVPKEWDLREEGWSNGPDGVCWLQVDARLKADPSLPTCSAGLVTAPMRILSLASRSLGGAPASAEGKNRFSDIVFGKRNAAGRLLSAARDSQPSAKQANE